MSNFDKPQPSNSLINLTKLKNRGKEWQVFTYVLNKDIVNPAGQPVNLYGVLILLGNFNSQEKAENYAKEVIEKTGHSSIYVAQQCYPIPLEATASTNIVSVPIENGKLKELQNSQYKQDCEIYEKKQKLNHELVVEAENETNPDHIEHFKNQAFLAINNYSLYKQHLKDSQAAFANYNKRALKVRQHYKAHPEHEELWLSMLEDKLNQRGEQSLFNSIKNGYNEIRSELLGLNDTIVCECPNSSCQGL